MAVLPFQSVANDASTNALGLGLTETVTAKLVQGFSGGRLQLVSTRDLMARGVKTSDQARSEFGTDLVLEGSLQQDGSRTRITWSLVDPQTHTQIAANSITGNTGDIFGLQDHLIDDVLEKLPRAVEPGRRLALKEQPDTTPAAYDFYLRGRGYLEDYKIQDNLESAIAEFKRAIAVDENYAPAYAAMGLAYTRGFQQENRGKHWLDTSQTECKRALEITPQLAEGHTCLGNVYFAQGRYEDAVREFQRSLDLDHNSDETLTLLAAAYQKTGNITGAESAFRNAIRLRPNYYGVYSSFGTFYYEQARYEDAAQMFRKVIQLAPRNYLGYSNLGGIDLLQGRYQEAVDVLKTSIALRPTFLAYGNLGAAFFYLRQYEDSVDALRQAIKIEDKDWLNWGNLGDTLYQIPSQRVQGLNAYRKAIDLASARLEVNPHDWSLLAYMADYYAMLDQGKEARDHLARALALAPADGEVLFHAAILYNHFGETEKTLTSLRRAVDAGFSPTQIRDTPDFDHLRSQGLLRTLLPAR